MNCRKWSVFSQQTVGIKGADPGLSNWKSGSTRMSRGFWSLKEAPLRLLMEQVPGLLWTTDRNLKISAHWGRGLQAAKIRLGSLTGQDVREFLGVADPHATPIVEHHSALRGVVSHFEY